MRMKRGRMGSSCASQRSRPGQPVRVHVCQASSCRRAGGAAVLVEIEELLSAVGAGGQCTARPAGCLGACRRAPNALVVRDGRQELLSRLSDPESCRAVVVRATGLSGGQLEQAASARLAEARRAQIRRTARRDSKWNIALAGLAERVAGATGSQRRGLQLELGTLLSAAGQWEKALVELRQARAATPIGAMERVVLEEAKLLARLGLGAEIELLAGEVSRMFCDPEDLHYERRILDRLKAAKSQLQQPGADRTIEDYASWRLESVHSVSKHSAIYRLSSHDPLRGTPRLTRGGSSGAVTHRTWHTTMLAQVGPNAEGPLPWVERDYTPISSAQEWERGRCDMLIKSYQAGAASSWLVKTPVGSRVWLSHPMKTLAVPSLVENTEDSTFRPASYLLVLAGTGIVAAAQILHHADNATCFGSEPVLDAPVSLVYSCRRDDVLMASEVAGWCRAGKLHDCTLAVTEPRQGAAPPFPDVEDLSLAELSNLSNVTVDFCRLSKRMVLASIKRLNKPFRVVVSGPAEFNAAAQSILRQCRVSTTAITVLSA